MAANCPQRTVTQIQVTAAINLKADVSINHTETGVIALLMRQRGCVSKQLIEPSQYVRLRDDGNTLKHFVYIVPKL